jgi:fluoride exporter
MKILAVGCGGFLGAIARYELAMFIGTRWKTDFPFSTFIINISGSFILAFFMALALNKFEINPLWRLFFAVGFLGAYTTFSTLEYETFNLLHDSQFFLVSLNLLGSMIAGLIAVWLGNLAAKML